MIHVRKSLLLISIFSAGLLLASCGEKKSNSNAASKPVKPVVKPTATPVPTPKPIAEKLHEFVPENPPFEKLKPLAIFREDEFLGMGVFVDQSFIVTPLQYFPGPSRSQRSVAEISIMPSGKPIHPPKTPTPEEIKASEGSYYYYQEIGPEVSAKYGIVGAEPNHAAHLDAANVAPGPRNQVNGFAPPQGPPSALQFIAEHEKEYISVLTGKHYKSSVALDLGNVPEKVLRAPQVVFALSSSEEPLEIGYPFATPGERLLIINRIESLTDDVRSSLTLVGAAVPDGADKLAIGGLLPRYLDYEQKYGILLGSVVEEEVSKKYEPILIYRNSMFHGSGTLVHDGDSTPTIVSTRHQFAASDEALFSYQRLRPLDMETLYPLNAVRGCNDERLDIVIARPGDGPEIKGVPGARMSVEPDEVTDPSFKTWLNFESRHIYTSLLTGLKYEGYTLRDGAGKDTPYILIFYTILVGKGESGSGFERDDGKLFTLRGGMELRDHMRDEVAAEGIELGPEIDWMIFGAMVPDADLQPTKKRKK